MRVVGLVFASVVLVAACSTEEPPPSPPSLPPPPPLCERVDAIDAVIPEGAFDYTWSCSGEVAASGTPLPSDAVADDCTTGVWPDLDELTHVCPTVSDAVRTDPDSGLELPSQDPRPLPTTIPVTEAGSFRTDPEPASWPSQIKVVAWNMEYTRGLEAQIDTLLTHPDLADAELFLLSEVDRCSTRNGVRRAARLIAQALEADYVYGIEFVELNIGRDIGGDTGQAIVSRRPLTDAVLTCHSSQSDWFASEDEPRLGQRVVLSADVPLGDTFARVHTVHLESDDVLGEGRAEQSKELLDAAQAKACDRPQISAGDYNAPYCGTPELQVFRDAGWLDAIGTAGDLDPTHEAGLRLDYVLSRGFSVVDGGVLRDVSTSDHYPLWAVLELGPTP